MNDLESLAFQGEKILRQKDRERAEQKAKAEDKRTGSWRLLRAAVEKEAPALLPLVPEYPPDEHPWNSYPPHDWTLHLKPFGNAVLNVRLQYGSLDRNEFWHLSCSHHEHSRKSNRYSVAVQYELRKYDEGYYPLPIEDYTGDLAEALALCKRAEPLLAAAKVECERMDRQARRVEKVKPPTTGETLLAALDNYIYESYQKTHRGFEDDE